MKANDKLDRLIAEQSSEWIEALKHHGPKTMEAFGEWLLESKRHMNIFLRMTQLDRELERFDPERRIPIPNLRDSGAEVVPLYLRNGLPYSDASGPRTDAAAPAAVSPAGRVSKRRWGKLYGWFSAAVAVSGLSVLFALGWLPGFSNGWTEYSTAVGEQQVVELQDGSTVHLNTRSRIVVRLSEHGRDIRLLSGEALFKVRQDPTRPFRVYTQGAFIQAIGTQFNVYRRVEGTSVTVLEGRVRISSNTDPLDVEAVRDGGAAARAGNPGAHPATAYLSAGEGARIDDVGRIADQGRTDTARVSAWSERRLVFKRESLAEIVAQFNRYNRSPQFRVVGTSIATRRYSGAFDVNDPQSLSDLLGTEPDLLVESRGDEVVIRARLAVRAADAVVPSGR